MQSLFKKKKAKRKDLDRAPSSDVNADNGVTAENDADMARQRSHTISGAVKGKFKSKRSRASVFGRTPSPSNIASVSPQASSSSDNVPTDDDLLMSYFSTTQSEKIIMDMVRGPAKNSPSLWKFDQPSRRTRSVRVAGCDVSVRRVSQMLVLLASSTTSAASRSILPGDILLAVNEAWVMDRSEAAVAELLQTSDEVELKISSLQELSWVVGLDADYTGPSLSRSRMSATDVLGLQQPSSLARSEQELQQERSYLDSQHVWVVHRVGITPATMLKDSDDVDADISKTESTRLVQLRNGQVFRVDDTDIDKINPPCNDTVSNLIVLRQLNESTVLHTLRQRYRWGLRYTKAGRHLVCINPGANYPINPGLGVEQLHRCHASNLPPHPFAVAYRSRERMTQLRRDQTIIPLGISGSGKSFVASQVLTYLASMTPKAKGCTVTSQTLADVQLLLQAFSSAAGFIHDSASRVTARYTLNFDANGCLIGGDLATWFFERRHVAMKGGSDLNFNVFYQLWFGADKALQKDLGFLAYGGEPSVSGGGANEFLPEVSAFSEGQCEEWRTRWLATRRALDALGVSRDEQRGLWTVLAAIVHLGFGSLVASGGVSTGNGGARATFDNPTAAAQAGRLLGMEVDELSGAVCQIFQGQSHGEKAASSSLAAARSGASGGGSTDKLSVSALPRCSTMSSGTPDDQDLTNCLGLFVGGLYETAFNCLVAMLKRAIEPKFQQQTPHAIHVLDMPGLRFSGLDLPVVGQGFEDLCQNYYQERLQTVYHLTEFEKEMDIYRQEGIECNFASTVSVVYPIVRALDQFNIGEPNKGIVHLVEEELSTDFSGQKSYARLLEKINKFHSTASGEGDAVAYVGELKNSFCIRHGQSYMPVSYELDGWERSLNDAGAAKAAEWCLGDITEGPVVSMMEVRKTNKNISSTPMRHASMRSARRMVGKRSPFSQAKTQLDSLMDTLSVGKPLYIICLRPEAGCTSQMLPFSAQAVSRSASLHFSASASAMLAAPRLLRGSDLQKSFSVDSYSDAGSTSSGFSSCGGGGANLAASSMSNPVISLEAADDSGEDAFDPHYVRLQIRKAEVISAMKVYRQGFPERITVADFVRSFQILAPRQPCEEAVDDKIAAQDLLEALAVDRSSYRLGCTKVFLKAGILDGLRASREKQLEDMFVQFQARLRGMQMRRQFRLMKVQDLAIRCCQKNVRKLLKVREWPWWKLYTKVVPLLDVHRQDEELRGRDDIITSLQTRVDKLQKDTEELKESREELGRLQGRVHQLSGCLEEEQSASEQCNVLLEEEQMERLLLEHHLAELQAEHSVVLKRNEQLGLQATEAMLHQQAFDDENGEDGGDGTPIVNMRVRVLTTEHKRVMDALKDQLENEREDQLFAKRQLEKQVSSTKSELDDAYQLSFTMRKKMLRLESELADQRSHLEDEQQRNSVLERKQRRFDAELAAAVDNFNTERGLRDKVNAQKESEASLRLTLEDKLQHAELDCERLRTENERLQEEGQIAMTRGADEELYCLRKEKHQMACKLEEQEEELEELASSVHILEQARTRLETGNQLLRQQNQKDIEGHEEERDSVRSTLQRRVRSLEDQLEDERSSRQSAIKAQREAETQLMKLREQSTHGNRDGEKRLRKHLHHTMALLEDAQLQIQGQQKRVEDKLAVRTLRAQLDEITTALTLAKRGKCSAENDLDEATSTADILRRSITDLETRLASSGKFQIDLESRLDEAEEDLEEMAGKLKNGAEKASSVVGENEALQCQLEDANTGLAYLRREKNVLEEKLVAIEETCEARATQHGDDVARIRELEDKLVAVQSMQGRQEAMVQRLRQQLEEREAMIPVPEKANTSNREKQLREKIVTLQKQEAESKKRAQQAEMQRSVTEAEIVTYKRQVQQGNERIIKLQQALQVDDDDMDLLDSKSILGYTPTCSDSDSDIQETPMNRRSKSMRASVPFGRAHSGGRHDSTEDDDADVFRGQAKALPNYRRRSSYDAGAGVGKLAAVADDNDSALER